MIHFEAPISNSGFFFFFLKFYILKNANIWKNAVGFQPFYHLRKTEIPYKFRKHYSKLKNFTVFIYNLLFSNLVCFFYIKRVWYYRFVVEKRNLAKCVSTPDEIIIINYLIYFFFLQYFESSGIILKNFKFLFIINIYKSLWDYVYVQFIYNALKKKF